jgi:hypothetical protein
MLHDTFATGDSLMRVMGMVGVVERVSLRIYLKHNLQNASMKQNLASRLRRFLWKLRKDLLNVRRKSQR